MIENLEKIWEFLMKNKAISLTILGIFIAILSNLNTIFDFFKNIKSIFENKNLKIARISNKSVVYYFFKDDMKYFILYPEIENKSDSHNSIGKFELDLINKDDQIICTLPSLTSVPDRLKNKVNKSNAILDGNYNAGPKSKESNFFLIFGISNSELVKKDVINFLLKAKDINDKPVSIKIVTIGRIINEKN